jgi:hypothetical protein
MLNNFALNGDKPLSQPQHALQKIRALLQTFLQLLGALTRKEERTNAAVPRRSTLSNEEQRMKRDVHPQTESYIPYRLTILIERGPVPMTPAAKRDASWRSTTESRGYGSKV